MSDVDNTTPHSKETSDSIFVDLIEKAKDIAEDITDKIEDWGENVGLDDKIREVLGRDENQEEHKGGFG